MREPGVQAVYIGYERYGMRSDLEYFEERMEIEGGLVPDPRAGLADGRARLRRPTGSSGFCRT